MNGPLVMLFSGLIDVCRGRGRYEGLGKDVTGLITPRWQSDFERNQVSDKVLTHILAGEDMTRLFTGSEFRRYSPKD